MKNDELTETTIIQPDTHIGLGDHGNVSHEELCGKYRTLVTGRAIYYPVAYLFVKELGRGRQGVVFLCKRQGARGCVTRRAIKIFDPDLYRSPQEYWTDMERISFQITKLHNLQSPHLVSRYAYEETHGIGYIEMEAIDGMDMRTFLDSRHLETVKSKSTEYEWDSFTRKIIMVEDDHVSLQPGLVVFMLRRMLRGLERLHSAHFLHCDIKPGNVMIDRLGSVKLVDFGRAIVQGERLTFLLGAPMYMAPEIHINKTVSVQSDLYSTGLVGLEMLRGRQLVENSGAQMSDEDLLAIKKDVSENISDYLPKHVKRHKNLVKTLKGLLEFDQSKRFKSTKEAEIGHNSLRVADQEFAKTSQVIEYEREIGYYLSKLLEPTAELE